MIVLPAGPLPPDAAAVGDVSPLNAIWLGAPPPAMPLPRLGHLFLLCPLGERPVWCAGAVVDGRRYAWLMPPPDQPLVLQGHDDAVLLLLLSPGFIADMAAFLGVPAALEPLLHGVPLLHGDATSGLLHLLADAVRRRAPAAEIEDLGLEVIGQFLALLRVRHQALLRLAGHKQRTLEDLLPRLLQARQYIEARCLEPIQTRHAAGHVALSEYHFARLFKTAFDTTVHQYVLHLRLDAARHLLEATSRSVTDIALDVGYSSLSAFTHAFRRRYGVSPARYRQRLRPGSE